MKTTKYVSHTLKTPYGKEITHRDAVAAILQNIYVGLDKFIINDKVFEVTEDKIIDGKRVTTIGEVK